MDQKNEKNPQSSALNSYGDSEEEKEGTCTDRQGAVIILNNENGADGCRDMVLPPPLRPVEALKPQIPEKIRQMRRLYVYRDGSFQEKIDNFLQQGKFMEDYEDNVSYSGRLSLYIPTYHDLNVQQTRGYFTWRSDARKGIIQPAAQPFIYLYMYELICGIGCKDPEDSFHKMEKFTSAYLACAYADPVTEKNLHRWIMEFGILSDIAPEEVRCAASREILEKDDALSKLKDPAACSADEVVSALSYFAGPKFFQSPVLSKTAYGAELLSGIWKKLCTDCQAYGKDFFTAVFGERKEYAWYPLANAIHPHFQKHPDTEFFLDSCRSYICRNGIWRESRYDNLYFDRNLLQAALHEADRQLRKFLKTGHYLREKKSEEWVKPYIEAVLQERVREEEEKAKPKPKITIDFSSLDQIRTDAGITRDSLLTEDEMEESASDLMTGSAPVAGPAAAVEEDSAELKSAAADTDTAAAQADLSDSLPAQELLSDRSAPDMESEPSSLPYENVLRMLLNGQSPAEEIRKNHWMPSVVTDAINEALFEDIGDNVLECDGGSITLVEDYREEVVEVLERGNTDG